MFTHWKQKNHSSVQQPGMSNEQTTAEKFVEDAIKEFNNIPTPIHFTDPLLYELYVDPVITNHGRIYSRRSIMRHLESTSSDPLTNEPLFPPFKISAAPQEIMDLIEEYSKFKKITKEKILAAKDSDETEELIRMYQLRLIQLDIDMAEACNELVVEAGIKAIKNNLKIDSTNFEHRAFWSSKGLFHKKIPTTVNKMMVAANDSYNSVDEFIEVINAERRSSYCGKLFKNWFRDSTTRSLYEQEDDKIKNFVVR